MNTAQTNEVQKDEAQGRSAVRVAKSALLAYVLGDNDGIEELTHPESRWRFPGDPAVLPWAGEYRGLEVLDFMEAVKDSVDMLDHIPHTFLPVDAERVIVLSWDRVRAKATGRVFDQQLCAVATVRDGLLYRWDEHSDPASMDAALLEPSPEERAAGRDRAYSRRLPLVDALLSGLRAGAPGEADLSTARAWHEALQRGDVDAAMALADPDGRWSFAGEPARLPWAGEWRGGALPQAMAARAQAVEGLERGPVVLLPVDAQHVFVRGYERGRMRATGRVFENPHIGVARVEGGRVRWWLEYAETSALERAAGG